MPRFERAAATTTSTPSAAAKSPQQWAADAERRPRVPGRREPEELRRLPVRLNQTEYAALERLAELDETSLQKLVRQAIRELVERRQRGGKAK